MTKLSVVVALYNEEDNVEPLSKAIFKALEGIDFEIIMVSDGSKDNTVKNIRELDSGKIRLIELMKNYGQSSAMAAGIEAAAGEFIATIDGDLQNDPKDIPAMLDMAESGKWDMVAGIRTNRKDGVLLRKVPSKIANKIIRITTGINIKDYGCTLKVFRKNIAKNLGLYGELHRFIPVLASLQGAKITQVNVNHYPRKHGKSKYGIDRTARVMVDLLLMLFFQKFFHRPMHLFGLIGLVVFCTGFIVDIYIIVSKFFNYYYYGEVLLWTGILLTLTGVQLIILGIITEIIMRTYYESQNKKPYAVRNTYIGKRQI